MESIYIQQREAIATILQQARTGILQLKEWTADDLDPLLAAIEALIAMLPDLSDEVLFENS